jgi:hypothetical protein
MRGLRVHNAEIIENRDGILETILTPLEGRDHFWATRELTQPLTPALSPQAGRGGGLAGPALVDDLVKNRQNERV